MNSANPRIALSWSGLPPELLEKIGKRLHTDIDVRRFRAVCRSWRSSTPPYRFPTIKLPYPFDAEAEPDPKRSDAYCTLTIRIVYRIQLPGSKDPEFWLVKVEHVENGKLRIINPVTHKKISISPVVRMPSVLNILDYDVSEVSLGYALRYVNPSRPDESDDYYDYRHAKKVVFAAAGVESGEFLVIAIDLKSRLWGISSGDEKWSSIKIGDGDGADLFYDVAIVKEQLHATDSAGGVWVLDREFGWNARTRKRGYALKRRLVELDNGELVLVEEMGGRAHGPNTLAFEVRESVVNVGVYVQFEWERKWVDARAIKDCIIVVGDDCSYSVRTSQELKAVRVFYTDRYLFIQDWVYEETGYYTFFECDCAGICNCYNDELQIETVVADDLVASDDVRLQFEGFHGYSIGVIDCETGKTGTALMFPEYSNIFWPPPAWLIPS